MTKEPEDLQSWGDLLKQEWQKRAQSTARDFYVASSPGWNDPEGWDLQARQDVEAVLKGFDPERLGSCQVLEIGCGVGRLVPHLAPLVTAYTGFDVASAMVEEARQRCGVMANARFFESDGTGIPAGAVDRSYDLILALAVFIHCPREVIGSLSARAAELLAPGGEFRFQVHADLQDPTGIDPDLDLAKLEKEINSTAAENPDGVMELIDDHYYVGARFRYDELQEFMSERTGCAVELFRPHPLHIWGVVKK